MAATVSYTDILDFLDPQVGKYVGALLRENNVGVCGGPLHVLEPKTGRHTITQRHCCDRFKIQIPFAGNTLIWQVMLDSMHPSEPPDFIFNSHDFGFMPDIEDIKSLVNWDAGAENSLSLVINELLVAYKDHQRSLLNDRLQFEYTSLLETGKFTTIEVHHSRKTPRGPLTVNFLIRLPVDFSNIPEFITKDNPGEDAAILLVSFQNQEATKVSPQLYLSPRVEHALGGAASLRIPVFQNGGCLMDYVPNVFQLLENMVDQIVKGFQKRKEYIAAFLSHYGRAVLEYDAETYNKISLLFDWEDFYFILHINIPTFFPRDQPHFELQSVYHMTTYSKPIIATIKDYPYSPRWSGNEMAERAKVYLEQYMPEFKRSSMHLSASRMR
ncbi:BRISC and BRCA1-A complex member 2-like [Asterias rubens]|uniref:BRISC and BRCA1-A complex member 2-like n=1 Tax=Asterias rubens TaxID=7604 RepID=UPI001455C652|nr:BRISC and BRCA1-A complex member 2-like [Asterias rubens]